MQEDERDVAAWTKFAVGEREEIGESVVDLVEGDPEMLQWLADLGSRGMGPTDARTP